VNVRLKEPHRTHFIPASKTAGPQPRSISGIDAASYHLDADVPKMSGTLAALGYHLMEEGSSDLLGS
jgi:hypothetical protein